MKIFCLYVVFCLWVSVALGFAAISLGHAQSTRKIDAVGYNDTVIVLTTVEGACSATLFKTNEPKRIITCEEAKQIITTFPKNGDKKDVSN